MTSDQGNRANLAMLRRLAIMAVVMFGFGFALVPFYKKICEVGQLNYLDRPDELPVNTQVDRSRLLTIEFDANTHDLPWDFRPLTRSITAHPGEMVQVVFEVHNKSTSAIVGQAVPSYGPGVAARYMKKLECFCFTRQALNPGETRQMPVQFVVQSGLPAELSTITLSYTFFEVTAAGVKSDGGNAG
jgi:cytochrome c oxidase assembly protein subunit 11